MIFKNALTGSITAK